MSSSADKFYIIRFVWRWGHPTESRIRITKRLAKELSNGYVIHFYKGRDLPRFTATGEFILNKNYSDAIKIMAGKLYLHPQLLLPRLKTALETNLSLCKTIFKRYCLQWANRTSHYYL